MNNEALDFPSDGDIDYSDIPDLSQVALGPMREFIPRFDGHDAKRFEQMLRQLAAENT